MPKKIIDIFPPTSTKAFKEKIFSIPSKSKEFRGLKKKIIALIFFFLILTVSLLHFVFSEVRIEIWPETEVLDFEEEITADLEKKNMDDLVLSKTIPAQVVETEKAASQEFPSSGKISKEEKAQGKIKIFNNYNLPQPLVANTRFQAPSEKVLYFRSVKKVTVPAKGNLEIDVVADRAGEEYNIEPSTFSIPGLAGFPQYYSIYGKSSASMTGGFKGEISRVEKDDLERAKNVLIEKLFSETRESLKSKAESEFVLLDGVNKEDILDTSSSVEVGAEVQSFVFQARVKSQALVFKKDDLENFVKEFIITKIDEGKKIKENSLKMDYSPESINLNIGKIIFKLNFSAKIYSDLDTTSLKELLKKKPLKEAQAILEDQDQVKKFEITSWPPWIEKVPNNAEKIKIKLTID
jgi:hypothetical protein